MIIMRKIFLIIILALCFLAFLFDFYEPMRKYALPLDYPFNNPAWLIELIGAIIVVGIAFKINPKFAFAIILTLLIIALLELSQVRAWNYVTTLNDSSSAKNLTFTQSENQTVWIRLPKEVRVVDAKLNLTGYYHYQEILSKSTVLISGLAYNGSHILGTKRSSTEGEYGNVYVYNSTGDNVETKTGFCPFKFRAPPQTSDEWRFPCSGLAYDTTNDYYIFSAWGEEPGEDVDCLYYRSNITRKAANGTIIDSFKTEKGKAITGLAWDGTYLWALEICNDKIYKVNITKATQDGYMENGTVSSISVSAGGMDGGLEWHNNYLWYGDDYVDKLYKIDESGNIIYYYSIADIGGLAFDGSYLWHSCDEYSNYKIRKSNPEKYPENPYLDVSSDLFDVTTSPSPDTQSIDRDFNSSTPTYNTSSIFYVSKHTVDFAPSLPPTKIKWKIGLWINTSSTTTMVRVDDQTGALWYSPSIDSTTETIITYEKTLTHSVDYIRFNLVVGQEAPATGFLRIYEVAWYWNYQGEFSSTERVDLNKEFINTRLSTCTPDANGNCDVPLVLHSDTAGKIQIDDINVTYGSPKWSNNQSDIQTPYDGTKSYFNITWEDDSPYYIDTVLFESNFSGAPTNYTMTRISGDQYSGVYNFNLTLPAGTFYWKSYANASDGIWNSTPKWEFTIEKASTEMKLYLNGTEGDVTYDAETYANFTAVLNVSGKTIHLDSNHTGWSLQTGTNSKIENITYLLRTGKWNLTAYFEGDQNYTSSYSTHFFTVNPFLRKVNISVKPKINLSKISIERMFQDVSFVVTLKRVVSLTRNLFQDILSSLILTKKQITVQTVILKLVLRLDGKKLLP